MRRWRRAPAGSASPATRSRSRRGAIWRTCSRRHARPVRSCSRSTPSRPSATPSGTQMPGGPSQVRLCTDALVGLAKEEGIAVLLTGHVTKDGDLAGPRTLEHAVDVVLTFDGDPRSGLRVLSGGKNRFGAEGETAWFEMGAGGLTEIDPDRSARVGLPVARRRHRAAAGRPARARRGGPGARRGLRRPGQASGHRARSSPVPAGGGRPRPRRGLPLGRSRAVRRVLGRGPAGRSGVRPGHRGGARLRGHRRGAASADRRSSARSPSPVSVRSAPSMAQRAGGGARRGVFGRLRRSGRAVGDRRGSRAARSTRARGTGLGDNGGMPVRNESRKS